MQHNIVGLIFTLACSILVIPLLADAQQAKQLPRIGFLASGGAERTESRLAAFQQGLRALGYVEGHNIVIEPRYAAGKFETLPAVAAELVRLNVDVILAGGAPAAHAAKQTTTTIPIVMGNAADPVGTGLVASLAQPGGNVTGLSDFNLGVVTKRLEFLKEVVPAASRVAVLLNPANPTHPLQWQEIQAIAPALGVTLFRFEATGADAIDQAFTAMHQARVEALIIFGDAMFGTHQSQLTARTVQSQLPTTGYPGAILSYGTDFDALYRRAATYVDKILKGAKPADLPVEQPTKFELVINLKTAQALGITIPSHLLMLADKVLQ